MLVRRAAHRLGLRFRVARRNLAGSPDLVLPRHRLAIFVHGCFWHRHGNCRRASTPRSRTEYWTAKFQRTVARDAAAIDALEKLGLQVLVLWECQLGDAAWLDRELLAATASEGPDGASGRSG